MTSDPRTAFVWVWLPGAREPVVAGRLDRDPGTGMTSFSYGGSYLERPERIPLYLPELPLQRGATLWRREGRGSTRDTQHRAIARCVWRRATGRLAQPRG